MTQPVLQLLEDYRAAVYVKDVDAFISLYDEQVCVFDMWGVWSYRGRPAWREMVAGWFDVLGSDRVAVTLEEVGVIGGHDFATVHAYATYAAISPRGAVLRSLRNRITWTLQRRASIWRIVHEHTSAPLDGKTTKAILEPAE